MIRLDHEEVSDFWSSHSLEGVLVPTPLYHRPHTIRDFVVNRSRWSMVIEHREDHGGLELCGDWGLSREDLGPTPLGEYPKIGRQAMVQLTSQASKPNANMSVALVVRAWANPNVCGLMSSGVVPQTSPPTLAGSESAKADPKPPKRATPLLSTSTFL